MRVLIVLITCTVAAAQPTVRRGMTGELTFTYDGPELTALAQQDLSAPLLLRLERTGDSAYTARFIGSVEGEYDLRSLIRLRSGAEPADLAPLPVSVVSNLPDGFETDLYDAADLRVGVRGGYRTWLTALAFVWLAAPIAALVWRLTRRAAPEPEAVVERAPTLADQLRPLIEAASQRSLTVEEQARLELLLVHTWRTRLAPGAPDVASALMSIRSDADAGAVLQAVESWLHRPDAVVLTPSQLESLLAPYRGLQPVDERLLEQEVVAS